MNSGLSPILIAARYALIALIWAGLMVLVFLLAQNDTISDSAVVLALGAVIGATFVSTALLRENRAPHASEQQTERADKRKNSAGYDDSDPMDLLTDADREELRAEFKAVLRQRYLESLGEDGASESASFEALLEDRQQRRL